MLARHKRPSDRGASPAIPRRRFLATALLSSGAVALGIRARPALAAPAHTPAHPAEASERPPRTSDLTPEELDAYVRYLGDATDEVDRVFRGDWKYLLPMPFDLLFGVCARHTPPAKLRPPKVWRTRGNYRELHRLQRERPGGWHSLRRAFANRLRRAPLKDLQGLGGWKDASTLLNIYLQHDEDAQREALQADRDAVPTQPAVANR